MQDTHLGLHTLEATKQNNTYRTALWTGNHLQVTLIAWSRRYDNERCNDMYNFVVNKIEAVQTYVFT